MKITALFSSLFLTTATFAYVGMEERVENLEKEIKEISALNTEETYGASFTTSRPETIGNNWFAFIDIIYWHPKMGGTQYALTTGLDTITIQQGEFQQTTFFVRNPNGDVKENDFSWDLGFKVGLGYKTKHDKWDVLARYTWLESNNSDSSFKDPPDFLISLGSLNRTIAKRAKSYVEIDYDNIDFELARSYFVSRFLSLRPHIGLKSSWIDIHQNIVYTFAETTPCSVFAEHDNKIKNSCHYWGMGPRVGMNGKLFIRDNFALYGEISGSVLYGYFNTRHKEDIDSVTVINPQTQEAIVLGGDVISVKDNFHRFVLFVHMFLGLGWDTFLNNNRQHLGLKAGYEVQYFWRVNQMMRSSDTIATLPAPGVTPSVRTPLDKSSEDLMFYGITGEVRLDF